MEIERKFLVKYLPEEYVSASLEGDGLIIGNVSYRFRCDHKPLEQGYISTSPVIRIRKEGDEYYLTCKGKGHIARQECNIPMSAKEYEDLMPKVEGIIIRKERCFIPLPNGLTAELDIFKEPFEGTVVVEVEFETVEEADAFEVPDWFGEDVSMEKAYKNAQMSRGSLL